MERLSGAIMVLAGVALGGYSYVPYLYENSKNATAVTHIVGAPNSELQLVATPTIVPTKTRQPDQANAVASTGTTDVRVFSPSAPLVEPVPEASSASTTTWTAVVTTERATNPTLKSPNAADGEARAHLTSDLQRELKRVGCYGGEINGSWTQSTRRAMALFMERVNASLPATEPDYILLTLVQGHTAMACGTDCPAGQVYGNDGRCLPTAVVAQANKRAQRYEERIAERRENERRKAAQQEQIAAEQRVADARRIAVAQRAEAERLALSRANERRNAQHLTTKDGSTASVNSAKSAQVASVNTERLPWVDDPSIARFEQSQPQPSSTSSSASAAARAEPLPGMMSVGGPRPAPVDGATGTTVLGEPSIAGSAGAIRNSIGRDGIDRDDLSEQRRYAITAPLPRPAVRPTPPIRQAALNAKFPEAHDGASTRAGAFNTHQSPVFRKYPPAKIIRRPATFDSAPRIKRKYSAYGSVGKTRRGQPRPGTARYNVMHTLGGIY